MKRRNIILLVLFMTISVIGIRMMQVNLRENDIKLRNQRFYYLMNQILYAVTSKAQDFEFDRYYQKFKNAKDTAVKENNIYEFIYKKENKNTKEVFAYKHLVLEKGINLKFPISEKQFDSVFGNISISKSKSNYYNSFNLKRKRDLDNTNALRMDNRHLESTFREISVIEPIYRRINADSLHNWIQDELFKRGIDYPFEFGIVNDGILTKVHSKQFKLNHPDFRYYKFRVFPDPTGLTQYELMVAFDKNKLFKNESFRIQFLSDLLMIIILLIYILTIYFIIKQKRISQMKTDFINNMTHEFKTPIATINLIIDAMKTPRVMEDESQLKAYLKMLKQENKRMLSQVENILSLSVLDKIDPKIEKQEIDIHDVLEDAIQHVSLIIQDKQGDLKTDFSAENSIVLGDEVLLTNVFVNILDNAVKYAKDQPEITIKTYNDKHHNIIIEISDKGIGMSKSVQKKIFKKFYRETTGDIHNVKGHGLGLTYVQQVVHSFNGKISVKSIKGEGTTFTLRFPVYKHK